MQTTILSPAKFNYYLTLLHSERPKFGLSECKRVKITNRTSHLSGPQTYRSIKKSKFVPCHIQVMEHSTSHFHLPKKCRETSQFIYLQLSVPIIRYMYVTNFNQSEKFSQQLRNFIYVHRWHTFQQMTTDVTSN